MKLPRPTIASARPPDTAFRVENRWNARTGSSVDSTVTAVPSLMRAGSPGNGRQHHFGRRNREIRPVMFAQTDEVDPSLIGHHGLFHHIAQHLVGTFGGAVRMPGDIAKRVQTQFNRHDQPPCFGKG